MVYRRRPGTSSAVELMGCEYCGGSKHVGVCPTVKAFEYFPDGSIKRVEFRDPPPLTLTPSRAPQPGIGVPYTAPQYPGISAPDPTSPGWTIRD